MPWIRPAAPSCGASTPARTSAPCAIPAAAAPSTAAWPPTRAGSTSATFDARLIALDQATGELAWEVDTSHLPANNPYTVTGAPRAVHGKVFIGQSSSEFGLRGYLSAYDAETGELAWRFFTVPGRSLAALRASRIGAGRGHPGPASGGSTAAAATVWHSIVYDADFDQLLFGTGNGAPWPRAIRSPDGGDNLFSSAASCPWIRTPGA